MDFSTTIAWRAELNKNSTNSIATSEKFPVIFLWIIGICLAYVALILTLLLFKFPPISFPKNISTWGQIGDYIGGMLNPFFGMITVFLVIYSIHIQKIEFKNSINALEKSNDANFKARFENTLFSWLGNYRELVQQVSFNKKIGRAAISELNSTYLDIDKVIYNHIKAESKEITEDKVKRYELFLKSNLIDENYEKIMNEAYTASVKSYEAMYKYNSSEIDAVLMTIYRILKWIDEARGINQEEKWNYCALVRAQLSLSELKIFYYNCQTPRGEKLAKIANKYALFDNLDESGDPFITYAKNQIKTEKIASHPLKISAFSSQEAKKAIGLPQGQ